MREWSGKRVSNPRPSAWEADALPTELFPPGRWRFYPMRVAATTCRAAGRRGLGTLGVSRSGVDVASANERHPAGTGG